jgi:hypothetical protein
MSKEDEHKKYLIAKFKPFIARREGGIFTTKTRERLLGTRVASGRNRTKNDFWYDVRNRVKSALVDLELFVETADKEQMDQVLTKDSLEPTIRALLYSYYIWSDPQPNPIKAEMADMLIQWGFNYLGEKAKKNITLSHDRTMKEALDLSNFLLQTIKGTDYYKPFELGRS